MRQTFLLKACAALALALALSPSALAQDERDADHGVRRPTINVKPFDDLFEHGQALIQRGELDLSRDVEARATAELNPDGSLKSETVVIEASGGERLHSLCSQILVAVSESRVLSILEDAKVVRLGLKLDRQTFRFNIAADLATAKRASEMAEGYGALLHMAHLAKQGTDEDQLYTSTTVTADGRTFNVAFEMPRETLGRIISETIARRKARRQ